MLDKTNNAALIEQLVFFLAPLILDGDFHSSIQERQLAQSLGENVEAELGSFEDLGIGLKGNSCPALLGCADFLQTSLRLAPLLALLINFSVVLDLDFQGFFQTVNGEAPPSVKTAGNFVRSFIELAPRVELCKHNLGGGDFFRLMNVHGNTAAIVDYCDAIMDGNRYLNFVAI